MTTPWQPPEENAPEQPASAGEAFDDAPQESSTLGQILGQSTTPIPDMCGDVMARLMASSQAPAPCQYDVVFLSTYVDQSLSVDFKDPVLLAQSIETFESHLPSCPPCCEQLGLFTALQDATRAWMLRQEAKLEASGFSVAPQVMAALSTVQIPEQLLDESAPIPLWGCGAVSAEDASEALDSAPVAPDRVMLQGHFDACESCQSDFTLLERTVGHVKGFYQAHLAGNTSFPNVWPKIQKQVAPKSNVVWLKKPWVAVGSVAAALMLVWVAKGPQMPASSNLAAAPVNVEALKAALIADQADKEQAAKRSGVVSVTYQTPEAYLYSQEPEDEIIHDPEVEAPCDVSAMILQEP